MFNACGPQLWDWGGDGPLLCLLPRSTLQTLRCAGCQLHLGYAYRCTPGHLDYKRDLFCLDVGAVER